MAHYVLADGSTLSDEDIEREAQEYESGTWEGHLDRIHVGRPSSSEEPLVTIAVKFPASMVEEIDRRSRNRSDYIRRAVAASF